MDGDDIGAAIGLVLLGVGLIIGCGYIIRDIFQSRRAGQENSLKQELLLDIV